MPHIPAVATYSLLLLLANLIQRDVYCLCISLLFSLGLAPLGLISFHFMKCLLLMSLRDLHVTNLIFLNLLVAFYQVTTPSAVKSIPHFLPGYHSPVFHWFHLQSPLLFDAQFPTTKLWCALGSVFEHHLSLSILTGMEFHDFFLHALMTPKMTHQSGSPLSLPQNYNQLRLTSPCEYIRLYQKLTPNFFVPNLPLCILLPLCRWNSILLLGWPKNLFRFPYCLTENLEWTFCTTLC